MDGSANESGCGVSQQRLFAAGKVGVFFDSYSPGVEKRSGEETSVITLKLRVQPFDAKLAATLDDGVGGDSNIKATVFSAINGDPKRNFTRHDFSLGLARQNLEIFSTPDTNNARISLNQAQISGTYVRTEKDMNALALVFKATFGPVGRDELEYVHSMHRKQAWITFHEGEPILEVEEVEDEPDEENEDAIELPPPMFEDPRDQPPASAEGPTAVESGSRRKLHSHQTKAKARGGRKAATH